MRSKKYLLVICRILRLFVLALTFVGKYYLLITDNLTQPIQIQISQKEKNFFWISFGIFEIYIKFWKFYEKRWPSQLTYFRNYGLRKTSLGKCLKSRDSEKPSTGNMANGSKHCCSLNDITLTIFINHGEGNCVRKVSFSDTQNLKTVYYDIDFRREVLPA